MGVIYGLFDPRKPIELPNCRYFGQTTYSLSFRLGGHLSDARTGDQRYVCNWIRSIQRDGVNPIIVLVELLDDGDYLGLDNAERKWIAVGRERGWRLTNGTDGGHGTRGYSHGDEQRAKISAALSGKPKSPEHRAKIAEFMKSQPVNPGLAAANEARRGVPLSEEHRRKQSESLLSSPAAHAYWESLIGRTLSDEQRRAISEANTGNPKIIEAAKLGGNEFKRKFESDPEFAAAWRQSNGEASKIGLHKMLKKRMQCDECGMISNPQGIGHHQTTFGHTGDE